jgi:hypothetical protein
MEYPDASSKPMKSPYGFPEESNSTDVSLQQEFLSSELLVGRDVGIGDGGNDSVGDNVSVGREVGIGDGAIPSGDGVGGDRHGMGSGQTKLMSASAIDVKFSLSHKYVHTPSVWFSPSAS